MDKCIKVELPTGHVLLEFDEDLGGYFTVTGKGGEVLEKYNSEVGSSCGCNICKSEEYKDWVEVWINGDLTHFKVIAQYGDEFPV